MSKFDAAKMLEGTVDEVTGTLGERSWAELEALYEAETAKDATGKKVGRHREGVTAAITQEKATRSDTSTEALTMAKEAAEAAGGTVHSGLELQEALDARDAENAKATQELRDRVAELEAEIAAAAKNAPKPARQRKAKPREVSKIGKDADVSTGRVVSFFDAIGNSILTLPDLEFGADAFTPRGDAVVLDRVIVLPKDSGATYLHGFALLDEKGKTVGLSELSAPMPVGSARDVTFRKGSLMFRDPTPAPAKKAAVAAQ